MMSGAFHGVGNETIWDFNDIKKMKPWAKKRALRDYTAHNLQTIKDYNGFVFFCATDQFLTIVFSQIL